ncbi:MAG: response regulator [Bdellovibrionales bacterium]|nr:response regulator [Bdellovibrionales bacterium]
MANVLVIDDDVVFQSSVAHALEKLGHHCQLGTNLQTARELIRFNKFQVCILDHMLSNDETGLDLIPELQKNQIACIFVTAFPTRETFQKTWALGVTETFHKPLNLELLAEAVVIAAEVGPAAPYTGHIDLEQFDEKQNDPNNYPRLLDETLVDLKQILGLEVPLELLDQLREQCATDCQTILEAEADSDYIAVQQASHKLAGALMNFGLQRAEIMARAVHRYASQSSAETWPQMKSLVKEIDPSLSEATQFIKAS